MAAVNGGAGGSEGGAPAVNGSGGGGSSGCTGGGGSSGCIGVGGLTRDVGEMCGSSNPVLGGGGELPPSGRAASAPVRRPDVGHGSQSGSLDDEMWSIEIHFEDNQHMDRKIGKCDITYLNLLSLIESKGYCYRDSMYCLVEGVPGYELVDGMGKVLQMVKKCEHKQAMSLVVMQGQNKPSFSMLSAFAAAHSFALDDDDDEVMYLGSQEIIPAEYLFTQQSNNMKRGKEVLVEENMADSLSDLDVCSDDEFMFEAGDMVADDLDSQLREEKIELSQRLMEIKRRREHPDEHIEGDTDVEDLFCYSDNDGDSHFIQKVPVNKGPTEKVPVIYPVPSQDQWTKTDTCDIDPPVFKVDKGRQQTKRRKGKFEVPEPRDTSRMGTITCSNCKLLGHRYTSCLQPLTPQLQMRKNQHKANREDNSSAAAEPAPSATAPPSAAPRPAPPTSTNTEPAASRAPPTASRAPPASARRAAVATEAPPAAPRSRAQTAPNPPFHAPRSAQNDDAGNSFVPRRGERAKKKTARMEGYFNAGKWNSYNRRKGKDDSQDGRPS